MANIVNFSRRFVTPSLPAKWEWSARKYVYDTSRAKNSYQPVCYFSCFRTAKKSDFGRKKANNIKHCVIQYYCTDNVKQSKVSGTCRSCKLLMQNNTIPAMVQVTRRGINYAFQFSAKLATQNTNSILHAIAPCPWGYAMATDSLSCTSRAGGK